MLRSSPISAQGVDRFFEAPRAQKTAVARWEQEGVTSCLSYESNLNRFSFTDAHTNRTTNFKATLYDSSYAVSLIQMFRQTIGINLERESPHSACFLPKLCIQACQASEIQVALFGHVDTRNCPAGEVKWVRWGVFNSTTAVEQTFEVREDDLARLFIHQAPNTNRFHLEQEFDEHGNPLFDSEGNPIQKPAPRSLCNDKLCQTL